MSRRFSYQLQYFFLLSYCPPCYYWVLVVYYQCRGVKLEETKMIEGRYYIQNKEFGFLCIQQIHGSSYTNNVCDEWHCCESLRLRYRRRPRGMGEHAVRVALKQQTSLPLMCAWRCSRWWLVQRAYTRHLQRTLPRASQPPIYRYGLRDHPIR
jgi:hypothetical protein